MPTNKGNPFAPSPDSKIGRTYVYRQMESHNRLINKAKPVSDCHIDPYVEQYQQWMSKICRWKLSWDDQRARIAADDILKSQMQKIKEGKVATTDCYPSQRCEKMRRYRRKNPTWQPGWTEQQWLDKQANRHNMLIKKSLPCVDSHLGIEHALFKEFRAKNGGPLPPISYETPKQAARAAGGRRRRRQQRREGAASVPPAWGDDTEQGFVNRSEEAMIRDAKEGVVDPDLIKYIYNISTQAATNGDVVDMLKLRTKMKYPDIYSQTLENLPVKQRFKKQSLGQEGFQAQAAATAMLPNAASTVPGPHPTSMPTAVAPTGSPSAFPR